MELAKSSTLPFVPCNKLRYRHRCRSLRFVSPVCSVPDPEVTRRQALVGGTTALVGTHVFTHFTRNLNFGSAIADEQLPTIPKVAFANGFEISQVVKGCWQLSGGHRGDSWTDHTEGTAAVQDFNAFRNAGITTLDTADIYGPSEQIIGRYFSANPEARDSMQVMTKLSFYGYDAVNAQSKYIEKLVAERCQRLGVKKLDSVQLYWNNYTVPNYVDVALNLMDLQARGVIGHIGASNFDALRLQQMVNAGVKLSSVQVQYSVIDRRADALIAPFCQKHKIALLPYGVVAGGLLSDKYLGVSERSIKFDTYSKYVYYRVLAEVGGWSWFQRLLDTLKGVATKHNTTIANVASKYILDKPAVGAIIIGARNANHVRDHQKMMELQLDEQDTIKILSVLLDAKRIRGDCYNWERQDWAVET